MSILLDNFMEVGSIILFAIGFTTLLVHNNLIKKLLDLISWIHPSFFILYLLGI